MPQGILSLTNTVIVPPRGNQLSSFTRFGRQTISLDYSNSNVEVHVEVQCAEKFRVLAARLEYVKYKPKQVHFCVQTAERG